MTDDHTTYPAVYDIDGEEYVDEQAALAELLADEKLFANVGTFNGEETVCLFVLCNDLFMWACADAEKFTDDDILPLYKMHRDDLRWGTQKWCCQKRNERPQGPVEKAMRRAGAWDDAMEALPLNRYDSAMKARRAQAEEDAACEEALSEMAQYDSERGRV